MFKFREYNAQSLALVEIDDEDPVTTVGCNPAGFSLTPGKIAAVTVTGPLDLTLLSEYMNLDGTSGESKVWKIEEIK